MIDQYKERINHMRNITLVGFLAAVVLAVSTYAWFVGMRTVLVSSFDVEIASTESLLLSLDGETWSQTVSISKETLDEVSYENHTNRWGGAGLIPISTVAEMDPVSSRMKLYEKASLSATPGGYRLMASRIDNYSPGQFEQDGYVVFDLFIKNFSGSLYIEELDELDEEAIYLTLDSEVVIAEGGVPDTGIENSVRVAFGQVGRVSAGTSDVEIITGITCQNDSNKGITGICRAAQIWEPNDTNHNINAINWYNSSCRKRIGWDVTDPASYSGPCGAVVDGETYPTYAVAREISSADNVDIYDGAAYNSYEHNWNEGEELLIPYPYFTDTMKLLPGTERPTFMTLSANSITKVRIYVYLEGQDVDNYDFASIGKRIAVNFGFTKQRFIGEDIEYEGPPLDPEEEPEGEPEEE